MDTLQPGAKPAVVFVQGSDSYRNLMALDGSRYRPMDPRALLNQGAASAPITLPQLLEVQQLNLGLARRGLYVHTKGIYLGLCVLSLIMLPTAPSFGQSAVVPAVNYSAVYTDRDG